jgi:hypothetical protein
MQKHSTTVENNSDGEAWVDIVQYFPSYIAPPTKGNLSYTTRYLMH